MRELVTDFIREHGLLDTDRLEEVFRLEEETGQSFEKIILHKGYMTEDDLLRTLDSFSGTTGITQGGRTVMLNSGVEHMLEFILILRGHQDQVGYKAKIV